LAKRQSTARGLPLLARSISSRAINRTSSCPAACPACPVSPNRNCGMRAPRAAPRYGRRILPVRSGRCAMSDPPTAERARAFWVFDRPLHRDWLFLAGLAVGLVYGGYAVLRRDRASALVLAYELFWALPGGVLLAGAVGGTVREVVRALRRPQEPGTAAPSQPASRRKPPAAACRSGRPRTRPPCALRRPVWPSPTSPGCGSRASRGCSARSRAWTTSTSAPPTTATSSASSRPTRACAPATASCWRPSYGYPPAVDRAHGNAIGPEITDPSCLFDAATNRSYHVVLTIEVTTAGALLGPNHLDLAVSQTSSPLGGWTIYRLPVQDDGTQGTPTHVGCPCIGDYPHIGADKFGIHLTTNEYPLTDSPGLFGNGYNGAQIYSFSKAALAAGASVVNLVQFESPTLGDGTPSFTVWPAQSNPAEFATQDNSTEYFLQSNAAEETLNAAGMADRLGFWKLTNTASLDSASPALVLSSAVIGSETYGVPPLSEQRAGNVPLRDCIVSTCLAGIGPSPVREVEGPLDSNDNRMQQTWLAGGKLYGALDTIARVNGNLKAASAWFVVDPAAPAVTGQGYVGVEGSNVNCPAVAVLPSGRGVMAFTLVGGTTFPSAGYVTLRNAAVTGDVHVPSTSPTRAAAAPARRWRTGRPGSARSSRSAHGAPARSQASGGRLRPEPAPGGSGAAGSRTTSRAPGAPSPAAPSPGAAASAVTSPPCARTISRAIASPT